VTLFNVPDYIVLSFLGVCILWAIVIIGTAWERRFYGKGKEKK